MAPAGVDIYENMRETAIAGKLGSLSVAGGALAAKLFYDQVVDGGPWDCKRSDGVFESFGNFHYGAVGSASGLFPEYTLLNEPGRYQVGKGRSQAGWGEPSLATSLPGGTPPYGDDPQDQFRIKQGIDFRRNPENWHHRSDLNVGGEFQ